MGVKDALYNEQTKARGMITSIDNPDRGEIPVINHPLHCDQSTSGFDSVPPNLGEHNRSIFRSIGYSESEIDSLKEAGAFDN